MKKLVPILTVVGLIALIAVSLVTMRHSIAAHQPKTRTITREPMYDAEPVVITRLQVHGKDVKFRQPFVDSDDWYKSIVVTIQNRSNQPIVNATLKLLFPASQVHPEKGRGAFSMFYNETIQPGEIVDVMLDYPVPQKQGRIENSGRARELLDKFLVNHGGTGRLESPTTVAIEVDHVEFADGSEWIGQSPFGKPDGGTSITKTGNPAPSKKQQEIAASWKKKHAHAVMDAHAVMAGAGVSAAADAAVSCGYLRIRSIYACSTNPYGCDTDWSTTHCYCGGYDYETISNYIAGDFSGVTAQNEDCKNYNYYLHSWSNSVCGQHSSQVANFCGSTCCPDASGCMGPSSFGCASGLIDNGDGFCELSYAEQQRCAGPDYYDPDNCNCPDGTTTSPLVFDIDGSGFQFTDSANGVNFDLTASGFAGRWSWTAPGSTNAFLVHDTNGNGIIDNGSELFGSNTPQPKNENPNGFTALAQYDSNGDGVIDSRDPIFSQLSLWQDVNHDGVSQPSELHSLYSMGVVSISLAYQKDQRIDQYGTKLELHSSVQRSTGPGRVVYDVYLIHK